MNAKRFLLGGVVGDVELVFHFTKTENILIAFELNHTSQAYGYVPFIYHKYSSIG